MKVDLKSYIFEMIDYDPTENPRGIVTADEWNTILNLLKSASNYTSKSLQEIISDLFTASELNSTEPGSPGSSLIGVDPIPGLNSTLDLKGNVNKALKEIVTQLLNIVLGEIPPNSVTSDKLVSDLNFTGDDVTFNDLHLLNANDIVQILNANSTAQTVPSAKVTYDALSLKQDDIQVGTSAPTSTTTGDIYLQLEPNSIDTYTTDEVDALISALGVSGLRSTVNNLNNTVGSHTTSINNLNNTVWSHTTSINNLSNSLNTITKTSTSTASATSGTGIQWNQVEKASNVVHIFLQLSRTIPGKGSAHVATLPAGYRPSSTKKGMCFMSNGDFDSIYPFTIDSSGHITITNQGSVDMVNFILKATFCV